MSNPTRVLRCLGHLFVASTSIGSLMTAACTGVIDETGGGVRPGSRAGGFAGNGAGALTGNGAPGAGAAGPAGGAGSPSGASSGGSGSIAQASTCATSGVLPGPAPLARLTTIEYKNTLRDLFPKLTLPLEQYSLPAEIATEGFTNNADTQSPSADVVEALSTNAHAIATAAVASLDSVLPCHPATPADEPACGHQFIETFGKSAFRRPLDASELTRYDAFFDDAYGQWGMKDAARMVVEAMLQSPPFLYRLEVGSPADGAMLLTSREVASRLSYFLTDSMPDAELEAAADGDELLDPATIEREARRILDAGSARDAVAQFNAQWLRFDKMEALAKAPDLFPMFDEGVAASMRAATAKWVDRLFWDQGRTLDALLTDHTAYVDGNLAPLYGVPVPASGALSLVDVGSSQRSGVLTQAGLLAGFAHERTDAPVLRGVFVMDRLLCSTPPPPPAGVNTALPVLSTDAHQTTRQQLEQSHVAPQCANCHDAIDGIGFGFEHYDALGQWRTADLGLPVDDSGALRGTDVDGAFNGAVELGQKLASSEQVRRCVATQVMRYALAVTRTEVKPCMVDSATRAYEAQGDDLRELLVAVVKSDAFRYRAQD